MCRLGAPREVACIHMSMPRWRMPQRRVPASAHVLTDRVALKSDFVEELCRAERCFLHMAVWPSRYGRNVRRWRVPGDRFLRAKRGVTGYRICYAGKGVQPITRPAPGGVPAVHSTQRRQCVPSAETAGGRVGVYACTSFMRSGSGGVDGFAVCACPGGDRGFRFRKTEIAS